MTHTFHTRHDFTPELGWAAFQLLAEIGDAGVGVDELAAAARELASPLARRADPAKLFRSMEELGLVAWAGAKVALSAAGRALAAGSGRHAPGFVAAVHCLYAWTWAWGATDAATPSWSYRQVCREIRRAGAVGIEADEIVLKVVAAAEPFEAERVSFSRSSVNGVTAWLGAQTPALVEQMGTRFQRPVAHRPGMTCVRYQIAAICRTGGGSAELVGRAGECLADALLLPREELRAVLEDSLAGDEFHMLAGASRVAFRGSTDPFIEWLVNG